MILVNHKLKVSEKNATDARETSWNLNHINESMIGSQILSGSPGGSQRPFQGVHKVKYI